MMTLAHKSALPKLRQLAATYADLPLIRRSEQSETQRLYQSVHYGSGFCLDQIDLGARNRVSTYSPEEIDDSITRTLIAHRLLTRSM